MVDTTADDTSANQCANGGPCSLRNAIESAPAGTTVIVPAGHYVLTQGELRVNTDLTIQGAGSPPGPAATTIDADGLSSVFDIRAMVTISGVVVTGGFTTRDGAGFKIVGGALTLVDSTVTGNRSNNGGAIFNRSSLTVERSTIADNIADNKGGALRNTGNAIFRNVTVAGNTAEVGSAISASNPVTITHGTIARNVAHNATSGAVEGDVEVRDSILSNNLVPADGGGMTIADCAASPRLVGLNLVTNPSGCDVIGPIIQADPLLGALAANGGATETFALLDGSRALDAIDAASCSLTEDQRGTDRPTGPGCDLGAYEDAPLGATYSLDVDTTNYGGTGEVEVGVTSVPTELILSELVAREDDDPTSTIAGAALRSIALRSIEVQDLALRSIDPEAAALRSIALRSIALRSIALRSIALRSILVDSTALRSILLSDIALRSIEGGWEEFIANTPELADYIGLPLQSITIEMLIEAGVDFPSDITLDDVSLESSALRSIALRSILLADVALRSIPIPGADGELLPEDSAELDAAWCELLSEICGNEPGQIPSTALRSIDLLQVQLAGGNVDDVPIFDIPISTALRSIALRSIALRSIRIAQTALRSIALRSIALRSIADGVDYIGAIVDCSADGGIYCDTDESNDLELGDVPDAALIGTVESVAGLPADLIEGLSFADLLLAFVPPDDPGWESLDIENALLQNISNPLQPTFDFVATVEVSGGPADLDFSLMLPAGFAAARAPGDPVPTFDGADVSPTTDDLSELQFLVADVANGTHTLRVPVRAGMTTGTGFEAVGSVVATAGAEIVTPPSDTATVDVIPASVIEDGQGSTGLSFTDELNLAHISSEGDIDLYKLGGDSGVPAHLDGETARIQLSSVPAEADYDLAVYAARPDPLRGTPTLELDSLGDFGFDLDPTDDIFPTDVADDIATDVPEARGLGDFTVRAISSRRSNEDEEVSVLLEAGEVYYIAVTAYLQDFSAEPYGLRVRVTDDVDPLECAAPRPLPPGSTPMAMPAIPAGVNTLYVTNSEWLEAELAAQGGAATVADIVAAAEATSGVNGVVAMVVPVDADATVRAAYAAWTDTAEGRCDPDARNAVVSAIGDVLDGITSVNPTVENIVLIGGDGVVPMAAVPDLTAYSNESTFATAATDGVNGNEISAALAAGMLLTDDPYGTVAGISVQGGDHELFLAQWKVGRLVETGDDILGQLNHFVTYDGQLDPVAVPGALASGVTGYDFLDDGAQAVIDELDDVSTVTSLTGDTWDRADYINLLTNDFEFLSPNAHYDWESLLPAAADAAGFFDQSDLVTTSDLDLIAPTNAVIFTMGCHAGLSIDDVQVGFSAPDWAGLYGGADNLYAAHTTYGYGDTVAVAYSERVMELFAGNLADLVGGVAGAPADVGEAFRAAKEEYLATTLVLDPFDEKILQSLTFYGLPMYDISGLGAPADADAGADAAAADTEPGAATFDGTSVDIDLTPTVGSSGPANLNRVTTVDGEFFEVDHNVVAGQYRPLQPLVVDEIPEELGPIGGFLVTELTSHDIAPFDPLILQPNLDLSAHEGRVEPGDGSFPASLQRIAPSLTGGAERLLVAAGQFDATVPGGLQRLFTHIGGELIPAVDTGSDEAPRFIDVIGRVGENEAVVQFDVKTDLTARRVFVLFREGDDDGPWRGLFLTRVATTADEITWLGGAPVSSPGVVIEFNVQGEGTNGRVGFSGNKVDNFETTLPDEVRDLEFDLFGPGPVNGYFTGPVTAVINNSTAETIEYSVDSGPFVESTVGVTVDGDGGHVVLALDSDGGREFVFFVIDASAPTIAQNLLPDAAGVLVELTAADIGQAGVASITYSASGAEPIAETTVAERATSFLVSTDGTTTITAVATDEAGNVSAPLVFDVFVDMTAPSVTATTDPAGADSGYVNTDVTVTIDADDGSGVGVEAIIIDGLATDVDPPTPTASVDVLVTQEGQTTIDYGARDANGNVSVTSSITVFIDKTAPLATASTNPAAASTGWVGDGSVTVTVDATDENQLASITLDGTTIPVSGTVASATTVVTAEGTTTVPFTVTDIAGNSTSGSIDVNIDRTAPAVALDIDDNGVATYSCDDSVPGIASSGVATCTLAVNGFVIATGGGSVTLPELPVGWHDVTVTGTDTVGNSASTSTVYEVPTPFEICLDYNPNQAKQIGSNYTIRLRLCDEAGNILSSEDILLRATSIDGDPNVPPNDSGSANDPFLFRLQLDTYVYNLDTTMLPAGFHDLFFDIEVPGAPTGTGVAPFRLK